jgi:hypothetical protein
MTEPVTYLYTLEIKKPKRDAITVRILSENYEVARQFCVTMGYEKHHIYHIKSEVHRVKNSRKRSEGKV